MTSSNRNIFCVTGPLWEKKKTPVTGGFLSQRPVTRGFNVLFDVRQHKRLNKQWSWWWFETPLCPCDVTAVTLFVFRPDDVIHNGGRDRVNIKGYYGNSPWYPTHYMMTSSNGNIFRVTGPLCGEFPSQRPVTRSFDVSLICALNKRSSKQSWGWWFETPSRSLWRHCNV